MRKLFLTLCLLLLTYRAAEAQAGQRSRKFETEVSRSVRFSYLLFLPKAYGSEPDRRWPVILYLHGGSVRGNDVDELRSKGLPPRLDRDPDFPFMVVSPQCPAGEIWTDAESIAALLDHVQLQYRVDPNAVYVTGHSMGGRGALYLAYKMPQRFAAVAALSPVSPITAWAGGLRGVPLSIIHGGKDEIAPVAETDELVQAIKKAGGDLQFTRLDERDHFILDQYDGDEIFRWLSAHRKAAPENASENEGK